MEENEVTVVAAVASDIRNFHETLLPGIPLEEVPVWAHCLDGQHGSQPKVGGDAVACGRRK